MARTTVVPTRATASEIVSFEDLRDLASARKPCITVALAIPEPLQAHARIRNVIREVDRLLGEANISRETADTLTEPIRALGAETEDDGKWSTGLLLFRSPDQFRYFSAHRPLKEGVMLADLFHIRPLASLIVRDQWFYVLAISQKHVRILRCTHYDAEELDTHGRVPQNLQDWLNNRQPDHTLDNRITAGPSVGSMKGVVFGTSSDRERQAEYLAHFFKAVDDGLHKILADKSAPLVLAGVDSEIASYRRISSYSRLANGAVHGSPAGLAVHELHTRALEIITGEVSAPLRKVLDDYQGYRNLKRVVFDLDEILQRTSEGRVQDLLLRQEAEQRRGSDDLLNRAAIATLLQKGQVFELRASEMPEPVDVAAVLRF